MIEYKDWLEFDDEHTFCNVSSAQWVQETRERDLGYLASRTQINYCHDMGYTYKEIWGAKGAVMLTQRQEQKAGQKVWPNRNYY